MDKCPETNTGKLISSDRHNSCCSVSFKLPSQKEREFSFPSIYLAPEPGQQWDKHNLPRGRPEGLKMSLQMLDQARCFPEHQVDGYPDSSGSSQSLLVAVQLALTSTSAQPCPPLNPGPRQGSHLSGGNGRLPKWHLITPTSLLPTLIPRSR